MSLETLRHRYLDGETTPSEALAKLAEEIASRDPLTGAYLSHDLDNALKAAAATDLSKPLGGLPIAIKDNINALGQPCTCGSRFLERNYTSPYDATVIRKLKEAGAIPFGRMNMDEFAMGSATENSAFQLTRNPHDHDRIPGGSSGGSAAAVADGTAFAALGSDTGGSIRQPASHCGVVGLKPTYGRVSRFGLVAFASSLDQIGPLTRTVDDAALILQAIAGHDPQDSTSLDAPVPDYMAEIDLGVKGVRIGIPKEYFGEGIHPGVRENVETRIKQLEGACRGFLKPLPLRWDPLRQPCAEPRRHYRSLPPVARNRLRPGGETPHHPRHLRAFLRILRCLLHPRPESPRLDHT